MDYYYRNNQQQEEGPIPEEILREWLKMGQINEATSVRRSDLSVWTTAATAFTVAKSPSVLLNSAPVAPVEQEDGAWLGSKARIVGGAVIGLLIFIAYQKSHRNGTPEVSETPVAARPQQKQPQVSSSLDASHQLVKSGLAYLYGIQCPVNIEAARQNFKAAAAQNDCCAVYWYTVMGGNAADYSADAETVIKNCAQLSQSGDMQAMLCVALELCCSRDQTAKQNGMALLQQAANAGDPVACVELGNFLAREDNNQESQKTGFMILKDLSDKGMVRADRYLSFCYALGIGTEKNVEMARLLMSRAAEKADPEAIKIMHED